MSQRSAAIAAVLSCLSLAAPAAAAVVRELQETVPAAEVREISIDFPVGELRVEAGAANEVRVDLGVECKRRRERCAERAERVRVHTDLRGGRLRIDVTGFPKANTGDMHVAGTITVPAGRSLTIDMGVGELEVWGVEGDVAIDMGVGEVTVTAPEVGFRRVSLDAGIGEASLRLPEARYEGRRSFLIGSELTWAEGPGESSLVVDLGIGEVTVRLEE